MEQKLLTLLEHMSSPPVFNGVRVKCNKMYHFPTVATEPNVQINAFIRQRDIKHIMMLGVKTITLVFKVKTNIITRNTDRLITLAALPVKMWP